MIIQADKPICVAFKGNTYYLDLGSPSEPISLSPINTVNKFCVDKDDDGESPMERPERDCLLSRLPEF